MIAWCKDNAIDEVIAAATRLIYCFKEILGAVTVDIGQADIRFYWNAFDRKAQNVTEGAVRVGESQKKITIFIVGSAGDDFTIAKKYVHFMDRFMG